MANEQVDLGRVEAELRAEYGEKLRQIDAAKAALAAEQARLELLTETAQARRVREREKAQAQEQFNAYAETIKARISLASASIRADRAAYQEALDVATASGQFQVDALDQMTGLIREFASHAHHFQGMADSEAEFQRVLIDTTVDLTAGLDDAWRLRCSAPVANALRIHQPGWVGHATGDRRAAAVRAGLRSPSAQAPRLERQPADRKNG